MAKKGGGKDEKALRSMAALNCPSAEVLPIASQPRSPRNFQDLIRYSTEAANLVRHTPENSTEPLDDEVTLHGKFFYW